MVHATLQERQRALNILGLSEGASHDEIHAAHRRLAFAWHPDRVHHEGPAQRRAEERLKEINLARDVLLKGVSHAAIHQEDSSDPDAHAKNYGGQHREHTPAYDGSSDVWANPHAMGVRLERRQAFLGATFAVFSAFAVIGGAWAYGRYFDGAPSAPTSTSSEALLKQVRNGEPLVSGGEQNHLVMAVRAGNVVGVKEALKNGGNPDIPDALGHSPLIHAIGGRNPKIVQALLDAGASAPTIAEKVLTLRVAIEARSPAILETLLAHGFAKGINELGEDDRTPIDAAPDIKTTQMLIKAGADVNKPSVSGWTPLMWAIEDEEFEKAELLIEAGALLAPTDNVGLTALRHAVDRHNSHLVALIGKKAPTTVDQRDLSGRTPLLMAVFVGDVGCVQALMTNGASATVSDDNGLSAYDIASARAEDSRKIFEAVKTSQPGSSESPKQPPHAALDWRRLFFDAAASSAPSQDTEYHLP